MPTKWLNVTPSFSERLKVKSAVLPLPFSHTWLFPSVLKYSISELSPGSSFGVLRVSVSWHLEHSRFSSPSSSVVAALLSSHSPQLCPSAVSVVSRENSCPHLLHTWLVYPSSSQVSHKANLLYGPNISCDLMRCKNAISLKIACQL